MTLTLIVAMTALNPAANARLVGITPDFEIPRGGAEVVKEFPDIHPGIPFREMIASWNVCPADGVTLRVEARAHVSGADTKWYTMANWSADPQDPTRGSVKGQRDADGTVSTDTLELTHDATDLDVRVTAKAVGVGPASQLKLLTFSFSNDLPVPNSEEMSSPAWGDVIDVPERAQGNYPNGGVLCSPTSLSMVLWHYSNQLHRPELNRDVPEVEQNVWDPVFKGAGNWPFNTAYAGSFEGIRSYVSRFESTKNLETWIHAGFPLICSVSFDLLRGLPLSPTESGHLVVLVGFSKDGDPVINDPAFKAQVRRTYKRSDFERAWNYSKRTVYLVYPQGAKIPVDDSQLWLSR